MGKIKNTELLENESIKDSIKEGKVKKNKQKKLKKLKDVAHKTDAEELAPKLDTSIVANEKPKKKKNKNKLTDSEENVQEVVSKKNKKQQKVANEIEQQQDQKKSKKVKKEKSAQSPSKEAKDDNELTEAELKKIEKKKSKKLAQKLKRERKIEEKLKEPTKTLETTANGGLKEKKKDKLAVDNANDTADSASSKVLSKKERKAKKRQLLKEKRLEEKQTRDPAVDVATVFVGNLPINTKRVQILRLFKDYGPVNSIRIRTVGGKVLLKHKQRKEAGALNAYVVLKNQATAAKALSLNGVEFKGHHLRVTSSVKNPITHEKEESKRTVFVGNLKYSATEDTLREIFTSCGEIDYVRCIRDGDKGCKGVAYVCFKKSDAVGLALELNQTILDERPINVERYSVKKLGAKDARTAQAEKDSKSKKGAKQRIDGKKAKKAKLGGNKSASSNDGDDAKKPKKNEFKGVKVDALKKKQKQKKKKSNNQMLQLAKKIAPKSLNE